MNKIHLNPIFRPANETKKRYRIFKGSAGSGKSTNIATNYILKLSQPYYKGANLLCVRKVDVTNRDSTYAELLKAIKFIFGDEWQRYWTAYKSPLRLHCNITGNEVIFRGLANEEQIERVKSINFTTGKLCWIWIEEATELEQQKYLEILDDRLRGKLDTKLYYQITCSFNPVSATHWIKKRFFDYDDGETFISESTYKDNLFIDEAYFRRMERRKITDPEGYKVYGLGEWGALDNLIIPRPIIEEPKPLEYYDNFVLAVDHGYNHANAILLVGFKDCFKNRGEIAVTREWYGYERDTSEWIDVLNNDPINSKINLKHLIMYADSAEPDRIQMYRKAGYKCVGVKKGNGSVKAQIDILQKLNIKINPSCVNTIKEIQQWRWQKDNQGNYIDKPVEVMDDAMAALRYSIEQLRVPVRNISFGHIDF